MSKKEKYIQYAVLISSQISEMFDGESSNYIDFKELTEGENIKDFIHALATVVPCTMFNKLTNGEKDHLEFNHLANTLCFEYGKMEDK